jgi:hypothetical protein
MSAPKDRGRREDRVRAAPAVSRARCTRQNAHEHTGSAEAVRPSLRNGFNGFLRALLGDRALLPPLPPRSLLLESLTPASGRRDHTTSPSALARSPHAPLRPPHPAPYVRDDREPPLLWARDGRAYRDDLPDSESGIFFLMRLDRFWVICPSGNQKMALIGGDTRPPPYRAFSARHDVYGFL